MYTSGGLTCHHSYGLGNFQFFFVADVINEQRQNVFVYTNTTILGGWINIIRGEEVMTSKKEDAHYAHLSLGAAQAPPN